MYYVTVSTATLLPPKTPKIIVTTTNLHSVRSKFERVAGKPLFKNTPSVQEFSSKVSLPQSVKTFGGLLTNLNFYPERIYFLNQKCVHCINLYTQDPAVNSTNVRWLNAGELTVPPDILNLFDIASPCSTKDFYKLVPFPHKLESKIQL